MKLALADREAYYGDPDFVDVPLRHLLAKSYADERRRLVRDEVAAADLPLPGDLGSGRRPSARRNGTGLPGGKTSHDTSYNCVVDRHGNGFSATPSDDSYTGPVVPGLGFVVSPRGDQSWLEKDHPSSIEPWKRPRLTPNPALALKDGELFMVFGTPGGDAQCQAMLQVFLNVVTRGMDLQVAIEAPRFASASFPASFYPHLSYPGLLHLEGELAPLAGALEARGHRIDLWPYRDWRAGGVCGILVDRENKHVMAGADPRREAYALAW
jgi:gamma-glutamyltranspeptidase/glutathione hydrolase